MALSNHYVCFSGFCDDDDDDDDEDSNTDSVSARVTTEAKGGEATKAWSLQAMRVLSESLGAVVQTHITRRTTVLVARQGLTRKRLVAEQHGIPVVSPRWLESHGSLAFVEAKVAPLFGYTFCATQMTTDEEKALTTIVERNGGIFDRTLTERTSMLFVPPGWMRQWQQQQRQRMRGRSSTGPHGDEPPPILPEKICFAWATEIPVVEYPRFLSMAALSNCTGGDGVMARVDFDTIARLCALPISVAGGLVPHTQRDEPRAAPAANETEEQEAVEQRYDCDHAVKRPRDTDDASAIREDAEPQSKKMRLVQGNEGARMHAADALRDAGPHEETTGPHSPKQSVWAEDALVVPGLAGAENERSLSLLAADAAVPLPAHHTRRPPQAPSCKASGTTKVDSNDTPFTLTCPFVQVALLGCTARELVDCIHMVVHCRFMRTPVVTPFTDVVVVGSEFAPAAPRDSGTTAGKQTPPQPLLQLEQRVQLLAQLRDHLTLSYGIPIERIVEVEWLRACYQRMMLQRVPPVMNRSHVSFLPAPLPVREIPPTAKIHLQFPSTVSLFALSQPQGKQENATAARSPSPRLRKRKAAGAPQPQPQLQRQSTHNQPPRENGVPAVVTTEQKQHEAELQLAAQRVKNLLALLNNAAEDGEGDTAPLLPCLFCFVETEFSRIDMAVVRTLIKHGKGAWLKKTRSDWVKTLTRTSTTAALEESQAGDNEYTELVRRHSVLRKRLCRMQTYDAEAEEAPMRVSVDGRRSRKPASSNLTRHTPTFALYVVPHGDQRPAESLLRSESQRVTVTQRHPLRYLPAVTQDYVLCCLAAERLLHPGSCFLFSWPMPTEAEGLARRRRRSESGKPLAASPWVGPRRHEKAPLIGVSVYFLCAMAGEVSAALAALRRVMVSCLTAAVSELGGHGTEMLLQDTVTHVVVVDVASVFESTLLPDITMDSATPWFRAEESEEREREELLSRHSIWPHALQDQLPEGLVEHVVKGRISLVGLEWLHASVAWGLFLDEAAYTLAVAQQQQQKSNEVAFSTITPLMSPQRRAAAADATHLPFEAITRTIASKDTTLSPQPGAGYQFDFSTPTATPVRPRPQRDVLSECNTSVLRQSCPRSTLRTPRRQRISVPRTISPAVVLGGETVPAEDRSSSSKSETATTLQNPEVKTVERHACTSVPKTRILGEDDVEDVDSSSEHEQSVRKCPGQLHGGGKNITVAMVMPPQWDPEASSNSCIGPQPPQAPPLLWGVTDSDNFLPLRRPVFTGGLRIHIVHDMPERKRLIAFCARLSDSAFSGSGIICNDGESNSSQSCMSATSDNLRQKHLPRHTNMAGVGIRLQLVGPSVRDADVLVTHQLTQRESVLAAIAAGLWVVTPKALQDCEARQCFLPLRDLSVYEWCPELLPPGSPRTSVQLAHQCRSRRQQRQATGTRLFEGKWFIIVSPSTSVGAARARSMRNVLETGGGVVAWATCDLGNPGEPSANAVRTESLPCDAAKHQSTRCSDTTASEPTSVSSAAALLEIVASQIRGREEDCIQGEEESTPDGAAQSTPLPVKELILLLDGFLQDDTAKQWVQDIVAAFPHAQASFAEAKRQACARRRRRQGEQCSQYRPWELPGVGGAVRGVGARSNGATVWPPTGPPSSPHAFSGVGVSPAAGCGEEEEQRCVWHAICRGCSRLCVGLGDADDSAAAEGAPVRRGASPLNPRASWTVLVAGGASVCGCDGGGVW
ncbi:hypothetical protein TraAM80_07188 [Trypanosoma rangeli]|uniref:BRCT domain-containing protein n=1 Tax=Trypanosoma rangeli TaxID=5698 RepID=A0A422N6S0_TRYRA|nr:uncharacterized protein TraAM80_07188 [Trypanosoma rangeli]RNF01136.1 hypothetical protein TraAM80_07188 [Trypanosoma rangeli]|eukprot:RNF01136.1 hypothetical protein TraAM80_07188 [Trypanosoma rangeli]